MNHRKSDAPRRQRLLDWWRKRLLGGASAARLTQAQTNDPRTVGEEVRAALGLLPELLRDAPLPNGVVEVVIEDARAPWRRLFDIHDGTIVPAELGSVVPWASIAGDVLVWSLALGPDKDVSRLRHTGDPHLAERVLAALARARLSMRDTECDYRALGCR